MTRLYYLLFNDGLTSKIEIDVYRFLNSNSSYDREFKIKRYIASLCNYLCNIKKMSNLYRLASKNESTLKIIFKNIVDVT